MIIGIGTRKGITSGEVIAAIEEALSEAGVDLEGVLSLASARMKENEKGLIEAAQLLGIGISFVPHDVLNRYDAPSLSEASRFGLTGVAEPAALALSEKKELLFRKKVYGNVTIAIAK
jgi:cobalt-precorrin 5A hydrolase